MIFKEKMYCWKSMLAYLWAAVCGTMKKEAINLGESSIANLLIQKFNKRKAKFLFLVPYKTIAIALIDKKDYQFGFALYYDSVKGKNSVKYFHQQAKKKGAQFKVINPLIYEQEILKINTSMPFRQGRAMDKTYLQSGSLSDGEGKIVYGVFVEENLVGYIRTLQVGEAVFISNILGHGAYLKSGIMYFLLLEVIQQIFEKEDARFIIYDSFWGNSKGLALFKKRFNFKICKVFWVK